jgi:hypothetical protein
MKIFAIFDKNDKLIICFPTREEAETYGKEVLGIENGWEYSIKEKFLHNSPLTTIPPYTTLTPQQTMPCKVSDVPYPFTIDYSQKPKTNEWNETGEGV